MWRALPNRMLRRSLRPVPERRAPPQRRLPLSRLRPPMATRRARDMTPHLSQAHGRYTLEWGDPERAILELDYLRGDRGEITAEVSATSTVPAGGLVHVARVNLLSTRSLSEYAGHVAKRTDGGATDWQQLVGIAAREVV